MSKDLLEFVMRAVLEFVHVVATRHVSSSGHRDIVIPVLERQSLLSEVCAMLRCA